MLVGLVGSGNMARALARGWGDPLVCTDAIPQRAAQLAAEVGGEALDSNAELARRADVVVLCHKPAQLEQVAGELDGQAKAIVSILGATPVEAVRGAYPGTPVVRLIPNTPVEVRRGVICHARTPDGDAELERAVFDLFGRVGLVVSVEESLIDVAMAVMSVSPAYWALIAEAHVDAAVRHGMPADVAAQLAAESIAGTAELLKARGYDTLELRRQVTSPGGSTARGLAALERGGVRAALGEAMDAVVRPAR